MKGKTVVMVLAGGLLAGCVTFREGRPFDPARTADLKAGVTTREQVVAIFGEPQAVERGADGVERLTYRHSITKAKPDARQFIPIVGMAYLGGDVQTKTNSLVVAVKDGVVVDYSERTEAHAGPPKTR